MRSKCKPTCLLALGTDKSFRRKWHPPSKHFGLFPIFAMKTFPVKKSAVQSETALTVVAWSACLHVRVVPVSPVSRTSCSKKKRSCNKCSDPYVGACHRFQYPCFFSWAECMHAVLLMHERYIMKGSSIGHEDNGFRGFGCFGCYLFNCVLVACYHHMQCIVDGFRVYTFILLSLIIFVTEIHSPFSS